MFFTSAKAELSLAIQRRPIEEALQDAIDGSRREYCRDLALFLVDRFRPPLAIWIYLVLFRGMFWLGRQRDTREVPPMPEPARHGRDRRRRSRPQRGGHAAAEPADRS